LPEGLITLSKHSCFGGTVSFHEHRYETFDVTMRFVIYAPSRRVLDPPTPRSSRDSGLWPPYQLLLAADARP
jgi:hypothetical protein